MNLLWGGMILVGILYGAVTGNLGAVTEAAVDSAKEAVNLCVVMAGVTSLWVGLMKIAEKSGLIRQITGKMEPFLHFLFPEIPREHPSWKYIASNIIANILGLGWAATPAGLRAMEELAVLEEERRSGKAEGPVRKKGVAGNEMCVFLILNISSLQLIPVNVIAYRSQYGSADPAAVVGPGIAATLISTAAAVIFGKAVLGRKKE